MILVIYYQIQIQMIHLTVVNELKKKKKEKKKKK